jgi:hypothetical protein
VAVASVIVVVAAQPVRSPWWLYADADATYTASGIELMAGEPTVYFDHPGLPLQDVMAVTVETRYLVHKLTHPHTTPHEYAAERLRHLGDSRIFFRGYAILFYVAGALFAFFALWRLLGNAWWGTAGTLLFLSAPGLQAMSIQFRPDGLLAGLALAVVYLIVRAAERRDAWLYMLATLLLGLTLTVKIHAIGLVVPLAIALLRCPPPGPGARRFSLRPAGGCTAIGTASSPAARSGWVTPSCSTGAASHSTSPPSNSPRAWSWRRFSSATSSSSRSSRSRARCGPWHAGRSVPSAPCSRPLSRSGSCSRARS